MLKKCLPLAALAIIAMFALAGCSGDKNVDPYAEVSLRQGLYGPPVISKGFKYKLVRPEIIEAQGHLCFVREGNVTGLIAGRSIADKIEALDKNDIIFNCKKLYTPYVHYKAEEVVSGADTVFISSAGSIYYPRIFDASDFRAKDHDEIRMNRFRYNDTAGLRKFEEKQFTVTASVALVEEDGDEVWMLLGEGNNGASLRIENPDDATEIILRFLYKDNLPFEGGITYNETEEWPDRKDNRVGGTVTVDFVKYMNKVFST